jgi:hypothetical protein
VSTGHSFGALGPPQHAVETVDAAGRVSGGVALVRISNGADFGFAGEYEPPGTLVMHGTSPPVTCAAVAPVHPRDKPGNLFQAIAPCLDSGSCLFGAWRNCNAEQEMGAAAGPGAGLMP